MAIREGSRRRSHRSRIGSSASLGSAPRPTRWSACSRAVGPPARPGLPRTGPHSVSSWRPPAAELSSPRLCQLGHVETMRSAAIASPPRHGRSNRSRDRERASRRGAHLRSTAPRGGPQPGSGGVRADRQASLKRLWWTHGASRRVSGSPHDWECRARITPAEAPRISVRRLDPTPGCARSAAGLEFASNILEAPRSYEPGH